jgi:hypothetical protein
MSGELLRFEGCTGRDLRTQPATAAGQTRRCRKKEAREMIHLRCSSQPGFAEGFMEEAVGDLWEPWMRQADQILEDEKLLNIVYEALVRRHPKSRTRGRLGVPAEIVVRMLLLKHIRNWSFAVVEREVRPNLLYREFTRVYAGKVPDAKTLGRQALSLGPEVIEQIQQRMVELAVENKVVQGRRMRVDTTVVETNIHYPTDSSLLGDGTRVLTRLMKKVTALTGAMGMKMRDRSRSVKLRVLDIARAARSKALTIGAAVLVYLSPIRSPCGFASGQSGEAEAELSQAAALNQPGGGASKTVLQRDRRWRKAVLRLHATGCAGGTAQRDRHYAAARQTGHAANQSPGTGWRHS